MLSHHRINSSLPSTAFGRVVDTGLAGRNVVITGASDGDVRRITRTMPLRKVAVLEDVAAQVVVLASERCSGHVTGELVTVAGRMERRVIHRDP